MDYSFGKFTFCSFDPRDLAVHVLFFRPTGRANVSVPSGKALQIVGRSPPTGRGGQRIPPARLVGMPIDINFKILGLVTTWSILGYLYGWRKYIS